MACRRLMSLAARTSVLAWLLFLLCAAPSGARAERTVEIRSARDLEALFEQLRYTPKDWQAGVREVPPVYIADIPSAWRQKVSKEITVDEKKRLFFRVIAPIVLYVNEQILETRVRAEGVSRQLASSRPLSATDQEWLRTLAARYEVPWSAGSPTDSARMAELLHRVDAIPPSLALAQSASESGWGTSRFAEEGNALFGQWSTGKGIVPAQQRTATHGDHRVAAFDSTGMSVWSYALNLNTHAGYKEFRARRADIRRQGRTVRGTDVVDTMVHYSERGQAYVDELKTIMHQNRLDAADDAYLSKTEIIRIIPKK